MKKFVHVKRFFVLTLLNLILITSNTALSDEAKQTSATVAAASETAATSKVQPNQIKQPPIIEINNNDQIRTPEELQKLYEQHAEKIQKTQELTKEYYENLQAAALEFKEKMEAAKTDEERKAIQLEFTNKQQQAALELQGILLQQKTTDAK